MSKHQVADFHTDLRVFLVVVYPLLLLLYYVGSQDPDQSVFLDLTQVVLV